MCCDANDRQKKCLDFQNGGVEENKCSPLNKQLMGNRIFEYCPKPTSAKIDICGKQQLDIQNLD